MAVIVNIMIAIEMIRFFFQAISIKLLYRIRGNLVRAHTIEEIIIIVIIGIAVWLKLNSIKVVIILIIMIALYSAMKIIENFPLAYSVLNPDTNSLSASLKSNGVRFISASMIEAQIGVINIIIMIFGR